MKRTLPVTRTTSLEGNRVEIVGDARGRLAIRAGEQASTADIQLHVVGTQDVGKSVNAGRLALAPCTNYGTSRPKSTHADRLLALLSGR